MSPLTTALLYASIAGAAIPLGGVLASRERIQPQWLEQELRHTVIAFGGGVLLAAIALVLVPEGMEALPSPWSLLAFCAGGVAAFLVERAIERTGARAGQLLAMLLDFVPEAMAMGASFAVSSHAGVLLALLIAAQNLPEGFNAFREITAVPDAPRTRRVLVSFALLALLGPLAAWVGHAVLASAPAALGAVMLASAGGILYLTFQSVAPQAALDRHWAPPLGAVAGFLVGMVGQAVLS